MAVEVSKGFWDFLVRLLRCPSGTALGPERLGESLKTTNHGGHWEHGEFNDSFINKV